jgi:hypothetical protein
MCGQRKAERLPRLSGALPSGLYALRLLLVERQLGEAGSGLERKVKPTFAPATAWRALKCCLPLHGVYGSERAGSREHGRRTSNIEHRTSNIEHRTPNIQLRMASRIMTFRAREVGWGEAAGGTQRTEGKESDRFSDARVRGREGDLGSVDSLL